MAYEWTKRKEMRECGVNFKWLSGLKDGKIENNAMVGFWPDADVV